MSKQIIPLPNTVASTSPNGNRTYVAGADIAEGQPLKFGDNERTVVPTVEATDIAIGIALDRAEKGEHIAVALCGNFTGTVLLVATGAIAAGAQVNARGATAAAGDIVIGRALTPAATGEFVEITHQVAATLTA